MIQTNNIITLKNRVLAGRATRPKFFGQKPEQNQQGWVKTPPESGIINTWG